jgi:ribosomal protein L16/L10AE
MGSGKGNPEGWVAVVRPGRVMFELATGALDNTSRLKELRHEVARIATVIREREIAAELDAIAAQEQEKQQEQENEQ